VETVVVMMLFPSKLNKKSLLLSMPGADIILS